MHILEQSELKHISGGFALNAGGAALGALGGGISYASYNYASNGKWNWTHFAGAVSGGAMGGALLNPVAVATIGAAANGAIAGTAARSK